MGQPVHPCLRGGVVRAHHPAHLGGDRRDEDQASPPPAAHRGKARLQQERRAEVHRDRRVELLNRDRVERQRPGLAGVVHENRDWPQRPGHGLHQTVDLVRIGHVSLDDARSTARQPQPGGQSPRPPRPAHDNGRPRRTRQGPLRPPARSPCWHRSPAPPGSTDHSCRTRLAAASVRTRARTPVSLCFIVTRSRKQAESSFHGGPWERVGFPPLFRFVASNPSQPRHPAPRRAVSGCGILAYSR